jgi:hypothetical protein
VLLDSEIAIGQSADPHLIADCDHMADGHVVAVQGTSVVGHNVARISSDLLFQMGVCQRCDLANIDASALSLPGRTAFCGDFLAM